MRATFVKKKSFLIVRIVSFDAAIASFFTGYYDEPVEINCNPDWSYFLDHSYTILIIGGSGSNKTNVLLNLIKHKR